MHCSFSATLFSSMATKSSEQFHCIVIVTADIHKYDVLKINLFTQLFVQQSLTFVLSKQQQNNNNNSQETTIRLLLFHEVSDKFLLLLRLEL